jgi:hypothetical protein
MYVKKKIKDKRQRNYYAPFIGNNSPEGPKKNGTCRLLILCGLP